MREHFVPQFGQIGLPSTSLIFQILKILIIINIKRYVISTEKILSNINLKIPINMATIVSITFFAKLWFKTKKKNK